MEWKLIVGKRRDPYYNLAREEVLFGRKENFIVLWQNRPSVIIGRHQNTLKEANIPFLESRHIPVVRRLTGGGAVYHDENNLNLSFFFNCDDDFEEQAEACLSWILEFLRKEGIQAYKSGRNDLCVTLEDGTERKISGCAMMQRRNRGLFHATLLYDADLEMLSKVLTPSREKLEAKGTDSVRSRVINIRQLPGQSGSMQDFLQRAEEYFQEKTVPVMSKYQMEVMQLAREKYKSWQWNFGRDPGCSFTAAKKFPIGTVELHVELDRGIIEKCWFKGDFIDVHPLSELAEALEGTPYNRKWIKAIIDNFDCSVYLAASQEKVLDFLMEGETDHEI